MSINLKKILIYFLLLSAILFFPSKTIFGLLSSVEYALLAIVALLLFNRKSIKFEMPDNRILLFAAAIFFASLSFLINNSLFNDLSYIIRQVEYLVFMYLLFLFTEKDILPEIRRILIVSLVLLFIWSVLQLIFPVFITLFDWGPQWKNDYVKKGILRVYSLLDNPLNFLGILVIFLGVIQIIKIKYKLIYLAAIYLLIILTASKMGFIIVVLSMVIQLVISLKTYSKTNKFVIVTVFAFALAGIVLLISLSGSGLYKRVTDENNLNGSIGQRDLVMKSSLEMLSDNWLWGIGAGNFEKVYLSGYKHEQASSASSSFTAENYFIDYYLDNGLIPTLILLYILISVIYRAFKSNDDWQKGIALSLVYFLITGLVTSLRVVPVNLLLFSLIGIQLKLEKLNNKSLTEE